MAKIKPSAKSKEALPTQQFVDVKGTKDGVLILKGGGLRQILAVAGVNFDLKSEDEQKAILSSYQSFLNSLDFSVQIFVHSRKINVEGYVEAMGKLEAVETNPLLKTQIGEYREFVRSFTNENAIMSKSFFVIVPYDPVQIASQAGKGISKLLGKKKPKQSQIDAEDKNLNKNLGQLSQRTEGVITNLNQIGLRAVAINDDEAIELFYNLYNPGAIEKKGLDLNDPSAAAPKKKNG